MIIIEGPDGAGKTTLVNQLYYMFDDELRVGERGTKDRDFLWKVTVPDTMKAMAQYALSQGPVTIWDRLFYSELVYAPLGMPPREVEFNASQQNHIERFIEVADFPVIFCMPPWDVVEYNIKQEHQMPGVVEHGKDIYHAYQVLLQRVPDRTILYDFTYETDESPDITEVYREVKDYIDDKRERNW